MNRSSIKEFYHKLLRPKRDNLKINTGNSSFEIRNSILSKNNSNIQNFCKTCNHFYKPKLEKKNIFQSRNKINQKNSFIEKKNSKF